MAQPTPELAAQHRADAGSDAGEQSVAVEVWLAVLLRSQEKHALSGVDGATHHAPFGALLLYRADQMGVCVRYVRLAGSKPGNHDGRCAPTPLPSSA